jgi:hypothetical protein
VSLRQQEDNSVSARLLISRVDKTSHPCSKITGIISRTGNQPTGLLIDFKMRNSLFKEDDITEILL